MKPQSIQDIRATNSVPKYRWGGLPVPWSHTLNPHGSPHQPQLAQLRGFAHALLSAGNALPYRFSYPKVRAQRSPSLGEGFVFTLRLLFIVSLFNGGAMKAGLVILFAGVCETISVSACHGECCWRDHWRWEPWNEATVLLYFPL